MATPLSSRLPPPVLSSQSPSTAKPFLFPSSLSFPALRSLSYSNPRKFPKIPPLLALFSNSFDASPFRDAFGSNPTPSEELWEVKRKNAALQMQQFVGEQKNDLLDYLRSLQPEKVAELSEPSPELKETIHSVVHGLLSTLSPRMHSKVPPLLENTATETVNIGSENCAELVENTWLQFQPFISLTRDHLARLLF